MTDSRTKEVRAKDRAESQAARQVALRRIRRKARIKKGLVGAVLIGVIGFCYLIAGII